MKKAILSFVLVTMVLFSVVAVDNEGYFVVNIGTEVNNWNPIYGFSTVEAQVFLGIYEGLVTYDPMTLRPEPGIAESWEISNDGKTITFHLRKDARYSNGDKILAEDFYNSWFLAIDPEGETGFASLIYDVVGAEDYKKEKINKKSEVGISAPDDYTFVVKLKHPTPHFLNAICHYTYAAIHPDWAEKRIWKDQLENVPCSGPYKIESFGKEGLKLVKNSYYWEVENVTLEKIRIRFSDEKDIDENMRLFNRYEIDWMISGWDYSKLLIPEAVTMSYQFLTSFYFFNGKDKVWENENLRRALALAVDWAALRGNMYVKATTMVPPVPDYPRNRGKYILYQKVKEAKALLEEEGYPEGKGLPPILIRTSYAEDSVAKKLKESWEKELGLTVEIEVFEGREYYPSLDDGKFSLALYSWVGDYADPLTFLQMWKTDDSLNVANFSNKEYDKILSEASLLTGVERYKKLAEGEMILLDSGIVLPFSHSPSINLIDLRFMEGWYTNALDVHPFKSIKLVDDFEVPGEI